RIANAGIRSVMTFGISHHTDDTGSDTWKEDGLVARMSRICKQDRKSTRQSCLVWPNSFWFGIPATRGEQGFIGAQGLGSAEIATRPGGT
ncbi:hypothetical protein ONK27_25710, partial [Salmonella enterica subsp. enterica serovar Virginia]|nr:hypothetical protein [Salmonella enterica subsp. enterica serovar Virginia]